MIGQERRAAGGPQARRLDRVFDGYRHTVEQAERFATRPGFVGGVGSSTGAFFVQRDDGVETGVMPVDVRQVSLDNLRGRDLSGPDGGGDIGGTGEEGEGRPAAGFGS